MGKDIRARLLEFTITRTSDGSFSGELPIQSANPKVFLDEYGKRVVRCVVNINSINELLDIINEEGKIILKKNDILPVPYSIEIYDDYRE